MLNDLFFLLIGSSELLSDFSISVNGGIWLNRKFMMEILFKIKIVFFGTLFFLWTLFLHYGIN
jgi:hypothetical protein